MASLLTRASAAAPGPGLFGVAPRVWLMTFGHFVIDSYPALLFALLPIFVTRLNIYFTRAGVLATVLLTTSSVTQPAFGFLQDRYPKLPLASAGLLVSGAAMAVTGFVTTYPLMLALVVIAGLGSAAFHPQAVSQAARASTARPGWGIAVFFTGGSTGTAAMTLVIVPAVMLFGPHATVVTMVPAIIAAALFTRAYRTWLKAVPAEHPAGLGHLRPVALPLAMLMTISILRSAVMTAYLTFLPALVVARTGSLSLGALALASFLFSGSVGALLGGLAANRVGGARVVLVSLVAGTVLLFPAPWLPGVALVPWMFVTGILVFASEAQVTALAQGLLPDLVGVASSLMMGVGLGIGNGGAVLTGAFADWRGLQMALTLTSVLMIGAIGAAVVYISSLPVRQAPKLREA